MANLLPEWKIFGWKQLFPGIPVFKNPYFLQ